MINCAARRVRFRFAKLPYAQPFDRVDVFGQLRISLVSERRGHDPFYARAARSLSEFSRVNAVTGNDAENVRSLHTAKLAEI